MRRSVVVLRVLLCLMIVWPLASQAQSRGMKVVVRDRSGQQVGLYEGSHALVIGVSNYSNGWPDLPGVKRDVAEVKEILGEHGFKVTVVMDPTHVELEKAFNDFIRRYGLKSENRILFYLAGHGHTQRATYGEEMGYIVPTDAPLPHRDREGFLTTAIDMRMIEVYAMRIQAKHALFLFDSCFSGSIFAISRAVPEDITYKTTRHVRQFITSGSADETVSDKSLFCQQFVSALSGEADAGEDGYVTGTELGEFLERTVINYSRSAQHPQYGKIRNPLLDKGDFVFVLPQVTPPPTPSGTGVSLEELEVKKLVEPPISSPKPTEISSGEGSSSYERGEVFFNEDFSSYEKGHMLPDWGADLVVMEDRGDKYLTSQVRGDRLLIRSISFPEDFSFEIVYDPKGSHLRHTISFVDSSDRSFDIEATYGWKMLFSIPQTAPVSGRNLWKNWGYNRLKIENKGELFSIFLNGTSILSHKYQYGRFIRFEISGPFFGQKFTGFFGIAL